MEPVSAEIYLGNAVSLESLLHACRLLSKRISSWLENRRLVWQCLTVRLDLEGDSLSFSQKFSRTQSPRSLYFHLERIMRDIRVASPVEKITVTLDWLSQAPASQLTMFNGKDSEKESRLRKAITAASRARSGAVATGSALTSTRRELMFAFYDPWRRCIHATKDPGTLESPVQHPSR